MPTSVPTVPADAVNLADVLPSCLVAMGVTDAADLTSRGLRAGIVLPRVRAVVVVLIDGLGANALSARSGHARFLAGGRRRIRSGFPTTTAVALSSLTTGRAPGQHGVVGYSGWEPRERRVINLLRGWDDEVPAGWLRAQTLFDLAARRGVDVTTVGPARYATSGMTATVLGGAEYDRADAVADRIDTSLARVTAGNPALVYCYIPELDMIGHREGWQSDRWTSALEAVDSEIARMARTVPADVGMVVTADHGMVDVDAASNVALDADLLNAVVGVAGDPRCRQLTLADPSSADTIARAWRTNLGKRAYVATREEAIAAGWFGRVDDDVRDRIGHIVIVGRGTWAFNDDRGTSSGTAPRRMVGQHGGMTDDETFVPLVVGGAFTQ